LLFSFKRITPPTEDDKYAKLRGVTKTVTRLPQLLGMMSPALLSKYRLATLFHIQ
jgi:hypothetical protein